MRDRYSQNPYEGSEALDRLEYAAEDVAEAAFNCRMLVAYAHFGEELFSGDAASIYSYIYFPKSGARLVKLGCGEFSRQTFESTQYPQFHNCPYDIYCIRASDLFYEELNKSNKKFHNPTQFLRNHALFVARAGQVVPTKFTDFTSKKLDYDIKPISFSAYMTATRNLAISTYQDNAFRELLTPSRFADFLKRLPQNPERLGQQLMETSNYKYLTLRDLIETAVTPREIQEHWDKVITHLLTKMGVERYGILSDTPEAIRSLMDLIAKFDHETLTFQE